MRSIKNVLFSLILLIEAAALVASYYVNRYAYVRAGLYRHFHYRRTQFEQTILSDTLRMVWVVVALIWAAFLVWKLWKSRGKAQPLIGQMHLVMGVIVLLIAVVILITQWREHLLLYPYLLLGILGFALINTAIGLTISHRNDS